MPELWEVTLGDGGYGMTFEQYYTDRFSHWVDYLSKLIGNREEAEDRVQDVFAYLSTRKAFCEELIAADKFGDYVHGAVIKQIAQMCREQNRRVSTVSIDTDSIDFLSSIRDNQRGMELCYEKIVLDDFYAEAIKRLEDPRKLSGESFETVGELRQYIFVQYTQNNRTHDEIGELVGVSHQNITIHVKKIREILTPLMIDFIGGKLNTPEN